MLGAYILPINISCQHDIVKTEVYTMVVLKNTAHFERYVSGIFANEDN
jgi:hypothetical protein